MAEAKLWHYVLSTEISPKYHTSLFSVLKSTRHGTIYGSSRDKMLKEILQSLVDDVNKSVKEIRASKFGVAVENAEDMIDHNSVQIVFWSIEPDED